MKRKEKEKSAGFVVVRRRGSSWEVLGLRVWGKIDVPKGHLDSGESNLAMTDQEPEIGMNPETKKFEHDGYHWLTWDEMKRRCYPYLVNAISWSQHVVEGGS